MSAMVMSSILSSGSYYVREAALSCHPSGGYMVSGTELCEFVNPYNISKYDSLRFCQCQPNLRFYVFISFIYFFLNQSKMM